MNILIIDDEPSISQTLAYALELEGFAVQSCLLAQEGLAKLKSETFDFLVLDIGLPDLNGFEVCKQLRTFSQIPVLFLSARNQEFDRILGLELGADDYVTKPFSPREVATRIKVILKRYQHTPDATQTQALQSESVAPLQIDSEKAQVSYFGEPLNLTKCEWLLLNLLAAQPERVFSREQIMAAIEPNSPSLDRAVDTHVKTLRAKLRAVNAEVEWIKTHRGLGYSGAKL